MPQRLTKGIIYSRSLHLAACASLETISAIENALGKEKIPAFGFFCLLWRQSQPSKMFWEWGGRYGATYKVVTGFGAGKKTFWE
ncbi:hypothetical protein Tco_0656354 [Tanacetum coccineum]|uniref:Uncharacterized protein n=1 Tax=Tanacetum coccineum TaxID=301880 RepID=A0ABQ4X9R6_9ASTR